MCMCMSARCVCCVTDWLQPAHSSDVHHGHRLYGNSGSMVLGQDSTVLVTVDYSTSTLFTLVGPGTCSHVHVVHCVVQSVAWYVVSFVACLLLRLSIDVSCVRDTLRSL